MIRVKDIEKSLKFYQDVLGMTLVDTHESPSAGFNLYFLGYSEGKEGMPRSHREGLLELTWNYGTEKDPDFKYHDGNSGFQGFGHICKFSPPLRSKTCINIWFQAYRWIIWNQHVSDSRTWSVSGKRGWLMAA